MAIDQPPSSSRIVWDQEIGKGAFGTVVYEGRFLAEITHKIAVKRVPKTGFIIIGQKLIEDHILPVDATVNHPNIVQYFGLEKDQDFWYIIINLINKLIHLLLSYLM